MKKLLIASTALLLFGSVWLTGCGSKNNTSNNTSTQTLGNEQTSSGISLEDAKQSALDRVPGATEHDIRIQIETENGRYVYEGEIRYNQVEYDFEIDANTGEFLEWSEDQIYG